MHTGYRLPTEPFVELWTRAVRERVSFNDFMDMLKEEFDSASHETHGGGWWNNEKYTLSTKRVRGKCSRLNTRFFKEHGIRIPVPPRDGQQYWSNMVRKFNLCEFRQGECF